MQLKHRFHSLDGLRGAGAAIVVVYHLLLVIPAVYDLPSANHPADASAVLWWIYRTPLRILWGGHEAVLMFFILSGLVLTLPAIAAGRGRIAWGAYYLKRLCRLYIPVWASLLLALTLAVAVPRAPGFGSGWMMSHEPVTAHALLYDVSLLFGTTNLNSPLWSLRWEIWFSLLLPFMYGVIKFIRAERYWPFAFALLIAYSAVARTPEVKSALLPHG